MFTFNTETYLLAQRIEKRKSSLLVFRGANYLPIFQEDIVKSTETPLTVLQRQQFQRYLECRLRPRRRKDGRVSENDRVV